MAPVRGGDGPVPAATLRRAGTSALAALCFAATPGAADDGWRVQERNDAEGYVLYVREAAGARYPSYRLETRLDADPAEAVESLMQVMTSVELVPEGQERRVLRKGDGELLIHTVIDMPLLVADRDVAILVRRGARAADGTQRVVWEAAADGVPAPAEAVVRIESSGYWEFAPAGPGRTRAVYVTHSDLGGSLPAWLVDPMMRDQVAGDMQRLRDAIARRSAAVSAAPRRVPHE